MEEKLIGFIDGYSFVCYYNPNLEHSFLIWFIIFYPIQIVSEQINEGTRLI